jgi:predicted hotdog family 3-hydroxylacyl-ACP dehydratase
MPRRHPTIVNLDHARIRSLIPHAGAMCLLDHVIYWDESEIRCAATSHRNPDNPMRRHGLLRSICGVEYAAQAMALHGALLQASKSTAQEAAPQSGYLVSLRDVRSTAAELDRGTDELTIDAVRLSGDSDRVMYRFAVRDGATPLLTGRATVVLNARAR